MAHSITLVVLATALSAFSASWAGAQPVASAQPAAAPAQAAKGPLVEGFGPVFAVPTPGLTIPAGQDFRVRFDVDSTPNGHATLNPQFETAARFLNMHAQAGVAASRLKAALVVHGNATKDVLSNEAYRAKYGTDNPNTDLLDALARAGVRVYLCGQSAASRGVEPASVARQVQVALSAMTAHLVLDAEGFVLNPF